MTTSITDARYSIIHQTPTDTLALTFDDPPETGWSVMPGFDEYIPIPPHLEPPRLDADEALPSQIHPSYPLGRPGASKKETRGIRGERGHAVGGGSRKGRKVGNLLTTVGLGEGWGRDMRAEESVHGGRGWGGSALRSNDEMWIESGLGEIIDREKKKEVPPGMAGAKRPPTPPSPALRPNQIRLPRSIHLRHLLERQQARQVPISNDQFDAPVPNETYEEGMGAQQSEESRNTETERLPEGEWEDEGQLLSSSGEDYN
ncbi:hypothetical protein L204_103446 [Cryptococcus depauperatus]